jgi:hypothetical protein
MLTKATFEVSVVRPVVAYWPVRVMSADWIWKKGKGKCTQSKADVSHESFLSREDSYDAVQSKSNIKSRSEE